ncbi:MAG TPA: type II secretion system protein [Chthonomonadaceae bacterium]|nr:type II secretion system protein [Chthonomonadaceae bacterium]
MLTKVPRTGRLGGFTLIELLVVMAIIGILAAMLFPVFAHVREKARMSTCASNCKQLNMAVQLYVQDNDDTVPLTCGSNPDGTGFATWQDTVQPYAKNYAVVIDQDSPFHNTDARNDYEYWLSYGMMGRAAIVGFPWWITRQSPWLQNYVAAGLRYDGLAGSADLGGVIYANNTPVPSAALAGVARPAEYAFIFDAGNFDAWHGPVPGRQEGIGYCYMWVDPGKPNLTLTFSGPNPLHAGGSYFCNSNTRDKDYGKGMATISFLDGHVKAVKPGRFLQPNTDYPDTLDYFWPNS